ncbi:MAG: nicotinamide mononucleotide transporter [Acidobacteria bacterium]|nr:nicotinamide mononucleotide transporter [Acidobacteriota bacterium]
MTPLEIIANFFNLGSVFLANRNNVHTWWTGIVGTILYGVMFYEVKLYADVILQAFFLVTNVYGWWAWAYGGKDHDELPITRIHWPQLMLFTAAAILITVGHGYLLYRLTDANFPFVDSIVLVFSIIAQFLLMKRKLENWLFWILVDAVACPLYAAKELYLTAAIYFLFLALAVSGLLNWLKLWRAAQIESVEGG